MSAFFTSTLKSSKKLAFLRKGVLVPVTHMWTDLRISNEIWYVFRVGARAIRYSVKNSLVRNRIRM